MEQEKVTMGEDKKEDSTKKLEKEFHDFQKEWNKEWNKFLTNDFHHLVVNVDTLIKENDEQHDRIQQGQVIMQENMEQMNQQLKIGLEISTRIVGILDKKI